MPAAIPAPQPSGEVYLSIFAETVAAVLGTIDEPWPRPYPYPYPEPDEVVIPPPRPAAEPAPRPPAPEEGAPRRASLSLLDAAHEGDAPALAMLAYGRHELFG